MHLYDKYEPKQIMQYFETICKIPHGPGNEAQLRQYIIDMADKKNYVWHMDKKGNLLVFIPATLGYENVPPILFQGHMDMVEAKIEGSNHDFLHDPIELIIEDNDIVHANGTTLGADNAVALVNMMALIEDDTFIHPPIELLFTVEEELGLVGVRYVEYDKIKSRRMVNMDAGDHETMCVSCAGAISAQIILPIKRIPISSNQYMISVSGLTGGHGGIGIVFNRASAIKLMGCIIYRLKENVQFNLLSICRPELRSIATELECILAFPENEFQKVETIINEAFGEFKLEYAHTDPNMMVTLQQYEVSTGSMLDDASSNAIADLMYLMPYGVIKRSNQEYDYVLCSNNIDGVVLENERFVAYNMIRSPFDAYKWELFREMKLHARLCGAEIVITDEFTGWPYTGDKPLHIISKKVFRKLFGFDIKISKENGCAEPCIIAGKLPNMEIIGMSPYSRGAHTTDEHMNVATFLPFWMFVKALLLEMCLEEDKSCNYEDLRNADTCNTVETA